MRCDIVIVGAGPAGIFTALELVRNKSEKSIVLIEKGQPSKSAAVLRGLRGDASAVSRTAILRRVFPVRERFRTGNFL